MFGLGGRTRWPPHSNTIESLDSHNTLDRAGRVFLTKAIRIWFPSSRFGAWWTVARAGLYIFRWQSHTYFFPILRRLSTTQPPLEHFKASSGVPTCCWASHNAAAVISSSLLIQTQCVRVRMCVSLCVTSCSYFWYFSRYFSGPSRQSQFSGISEGLSKFSSLDIGRFFTHIQCIPFK